MKDTDRAIDAYFERARDESPLGHAREYGFETRLRESIRHLDPSGLEVFGKLCWQVSFVYLPLVVLGLVTIIALSHPFSTSGVGSAFSICSNLFSLDSISLF